MKRSKPLKRSAFRTIRKAGPDVTYEPKPWAQALVGTLRPLRVGTYAGGTRVPVHKEPTIQCEAYRRLVAALPCIHCGIAGYSQAAHPNTGKACGRKLMDDRLCFPLCTVHPAGGATVAGCHERFDQGALFTKEARREIEPEWGEHTRARIESLGLWPARLPRWEVAP